MLSIPRLELYGALTGAQLLKLLHLELTLDISKATLWSDSSTVLYWLLFDSCHYKVFVGTRVVEIQDLTRGPGVAICGLPEQPGRRTKKGEVLSDLAQPCR